MTRKLVRDIASCHVASRVEQLIWAQARRHPGGCAVVEGTRRLSYLQLEALSHQLAGQLVGNGLLPNGRVCLLTKKSIDAIILILSVLQGGGTYVPLDPATPGARLEGILKKCMPCWLIAEQEYSRLVERLLARTSSASLTAFLWSGNTLARARGNTRLPSTLTDKNPPPSQPSASDPAYIMFTSGSMGQPKGVIVGHDSVVHFIDWANAYFQLSAADRIPSHSPLHFDLSVWDVFGALASGAELHLFPSNLNLVPRLAASFIRESKLTQWFSVPSVLISMVKHGEITHGDFNDLRRLIWCGDVLPAQYLRYLMMRLPHVQFTNLYGPTETTVASAFHTLNAVPEDVRARIPIGSAIAGEQLLVLDSDLKQVGADTVGDLYIGGRGLSHGYLRDEEGTARAFRELPPDSGTRWYRTGDLASVDCKGIFHFHGRSDRQIKSCGYRIELDEVAAAVSRLGGIMESAVVAVPTESIERLRICAAYVPDSGLELRPVVLKRELSMVLPAYMLPRRWLAVSSLPKNQNGKVDHRALEQRFLREDSIDRGT